MGDALIDGSSLDIIPIEIGDQTINPTPNERTIRMNNTVLNIQNSVEFLNGSVGIRCYGLN